MPKLGTVSLKFVADIGDAIKGIDKLTGSLGRGFGFGLGFKAAGLLELGIEKVADALREAARTAVEAEQAVVAFEVMAGSKAGGLQVFRDLQKLAVETPFKSRELIDQAKLLAGYGIATDDLVATLRKLGDVASGTGVDITRLGLAYGQVVAKGRFQASELRQFTEAGVGVQDFAKAAGVSAAKLLQLMEAGQVSSKVVVRAFDQMTGAGGRFYQLMQKQQLTVGGQVNSFIETWQIRLQDIGLRAFERLGLGGMIGQATKALAGFDQKKIDAWIDRAAEVGKRVYDTGAALLAVSERFGKAVWSWLPALEDVSRWFDAHGKDIVGLFADMNVALIQVGVRLKSVARDFADFADSQKKAADGGVGLDELADRALPGTNLRQNSGAFADWLARNNFKDHLTLPGMDWMGIRPFRGLRPDDQAMVDQAKKARDDSLDAYKSAAEKTKIRDGMGAMRNAFKKAYYENSPQGFVDRQEQKVRKGLEKLGGLFDDITNTFAPGWKDAAEKAAGAANRATSDIDKFFEKKRQLDFSFLRGKTTDADRRADLRPDLVKLVDQYKTAMAAAAAPATPGAFFKTGSQEARGAINQAIAATASRRPEGGVEQTVRDALKWLQEEQRKKLVEEGKQLDALYGIRDAVKEAAGVRI